MTRGAEVGLAVTRPCVQRRCCLPTRPATVNKVLLGRRLQVIVAQYCESILVKYVM